MQIYLDRWGKEIPKQADTETYPQIGVFGAFILNEHILISWCNHAPDVPELPGGRIDDGETAIGALLRETTEETAVDIKYSPYVKESFSQDICFYAEDMDQFWDYNQTTYLIELNDNSLFFEGYRKPKDALRSAWVPINDIQNFQIRHCQKQSLIQFGLLK